MSKLAVEPLVNLLRRNVEPPACWIGPALLPRRAKLLFGGQAKIGKSFNLLELARALTTGTFLWGSPDFPVPESCKVLLAEKELGPEELRRRALDTFAPEIWDGIQDKLIYLSQVPGLKLDNAISFNEFRKLVADTQPNVIMLDPISKFMEGDDSSNAAIAKLFDNLDRLIADNTERDMSIVVSHHFKKPPAENFRAEWDDLDPYNFRGGSKFYDDPDTLVTMARRRAPGIDPEQGWDLKCRLEARRGRLPETVHLAVRPETRVPVFLLPEREAADRPIRRLAVM
jgi:RecA-family ATPase